ncbi:acyl-coenzyme A thioesterase 13-like [Saccoglossus kowalevskii]|uniref:Acyl-coenzyme A thioesterase 13-like n=1 Tax=Saccoglossus kowalevskii TaxID=10224 RepID=A0ABM0GRK2_SACKO|nr:PREDICTED: acyl-coenzyme A thioesterase 13-like [Saccoglossus kowalevskii]
MASNTMKMLRKFIEFTTQNKGFDRVCDKIIPVAGTPGKCKFSLKVDEGHLNTGGTLHGGLTATLVDSLTTAAIMTAGGSPGVSVDLNVTYMKAVKEGETISINAEVLKLGKRLAFTTCDISNENGILIAQGRHTKFVG